MRRATGVVSAGHWPASETRDRVVLGFEDRFRRRIRLSGEQGLDFLLDLDQAVVLRHGDGLRLDDGGFVAVHAAPEDLIEVTAHDAGTLARLAWHLGNRHLPAELSGDRILIRDDHVIVDMLRRLGAHTRVVKVPFNPEGGAYGQQNHDHRHPHAHHHHDHGEHHHPHDHDHD